MKRRRLLSPVRSQIDCSLEGATLEGSSLEPESLDKAPRLDVQLRLLDARGLYPFQAVGAEWLAGRDRAALCDEQGTGKCFQALRALMGRPAIIVCPASLRLMWRDEAGKRVPSTRVRLARSGELPIPETDELVIASWDGLPSTPPRGLDRVRVVFDEAQYARGEDTERTRRARAIAEATRYAWILTGTPLSGSPEDLWSVLELAGLGRAAFGSWLRFVEAFGGDVSGREPEWPELPPEADPFIAGALASVMLRRLRRDVLPDLPDKTYEVIRVPVPENLAAALGRDLATWREIGLDRLPPFDMNSSVHTELAWSRIAAVREYCATRDEPLVLFSEHVEPVQAFEQVPGWGTITGSTASSCDREGRFQRHQGERSRARIVQRFQAGDLQNIALTGPVGGAGLTLTRSSHVVRVSRSYTPGDNEQREDRVARIGQTANKILVTDFVSDHPVEDRLLAICSVKSARINVTVDAAARRFTDTRTD